MGKARQLNDVQKQSHVLITAILQVILGISLLSGVTNFLFFESVRLGLLNTGAAISCGLLYYYYHKSGNMQSTAWVLCIVVTLQALTILYLTKGASNTVIWLSVLPPISFFLLGRKQGSWIVGIGFGAAALLIYSYWGVEVSTNTSPGTLLNAIFCLFILWLLFRHYEASRANAYKALEKLSTTDKLTGLYNRSKLDDVLLGQFAMSKRTGAPFSIVLVDCDFFKDINDRFGHLYGDKVLKTLATLIKENTREVDAVGRWGGEEYLIVLPNAVLAEAQEHAERVRCAIKSHLFEHGGQVTATFGITQYQEGDTVERILKRADRALYEGKNSGRDCVKAG